MSNSYGWSGRHQTWRYIPSPIGRVGMDIQPLVQPQPIRPMSLEYVVHPNNIEQMPTLGFIAGPESPSDQPPSYASLYGPGGGQNRTLHVYPQRMYQVNDTVPDGMRLTAPSYMVTSPRSSHRVLVPADPPPSYTAATATVTGRATGTGTATASYSPAQGPNHVQIQHRYPYLPSNVGVPRHLGGNQYRVDSPMPVPTLTPRERSGPYCSRHYPHLSRLDPTPSPTPAPAPAPAPAPVTLAPLTSLAPLAPAPGPEPMYTPFETVVAHTAKCDVCNKRNERGMSRCMTCGWQTCHLCTIRSGCRRTHTSGNRVHHNPIEQDKLELRELSKGKKKQQRPKKKERAAPRVELPKRITRASTAKERADATIAGPSNAAGPSNESAPGAGNGGGASETESVMNGATGLYALCVEAYGTLAREDRLRGGQEVEVDDEATEIMSDEAGSPSNSRPKPPNDLHNYAVGQAKLAMNCFRQRKKRRNERFADVAMSAAGESEPFMGTIERGKAKGPIGPLNDFPVSDGETTEPFSDLEDTHVPKNLKAPKINRVMKHPKDKKGKSRAQSYGRRNPAK